MINLLKSKLRTLRHWKDNVSRIIDFIPILWNDWDFDCSTGLHKLIRKKLQRLEPNIRNGYAVDGERDARRIRVVISVLDRIIEDEYSERELVDHNKKWGKGEMIIIRPIDSDKSSIEFVFDGVKNDEDEEVRRKEYMAASILAGQKKNKDLEWVFKILGKYHMEWWD